VLLDSEDGGSSSFRIVDGLPDSTEYYSEQGYWKSRFCSSLALRAEHRLGVFENRVMRRISGTEEG
jgi:hypothetical protein